MGELGHALQPLSDVTLTISPESVLRCVSSRGGDFSTYLTSIEGGEYFDRLQVAGRLLAVCATCVINCA